MVPSPSKEEEVGYEDDHLKIQDGILTIQSYYFPFANSKTIPIEDIQCTTRHPMNGIFSGKGRIWGSGNLHNWLNCDIHRSSKSYLFVHELNGSYWRPTTTPEDPKAFMKALIDAGVETIESDTTIYC